MSAMLSRPVAGGWLAILLRGGPYQVIGPVGRPYLLRWFLVPHNKILNVYLQTFTSSDDPEAFHDHGSLRCAHRGFATASSCPRARTVARGVSHAGGDGPKVRRWGFWCTRERFVPWAQLDGGCGEEQQR
jgi:hypothetical protein